MPDEQPGHVLVRMAHAAVCGSDLHTLHDHPAATFPRSPGCSGHECVGVVVSNGLSGPNVGQAVLVIPPRDDGFAEYLSVEPQHVIPIPGDLTLEEGLLAQQLGTVLHCLHKLDNVIGKSAVIVGQGPAGLLFTTLLAQMGARRVIGLDRVDHRLEVARLMGATHAVHVERVDPTEAVREITQGGMADVVIEAVGEAEPINLCARLVRPKGTVALFGVPKSPSVTFDYDAFFRKQAQLFFSVDTQSERDHWPFRLALDLVARGRVDVSPLASHRLPFERIDEAFRLARTPADDGAVKVLLHFNQGT